MKKFPIKEPVEQIASLNEFLEQGNPIASKGVTRHQIVLDGVIESMNNLAVNTQNTAQSLKKAFDTMNELNSKLEKTRPLTSPNTAKIIKTIKP